MKIQGMGGMEAPIASKQVREERAVFRLPPDEVPDGALTEAVNNVKASLEGLSAQDAVHLRSVARQIRTNTYDIGGDAIAERMLRGVANGNPLRAYQRAAAGEEETP